MELSAPEVTPFIGSKVNKKLGFTGFMLSKMGNPIMHFLFKSFPYLTVLMPKFAVAKEEKFTV